MYKKLDEDELNRLAIKVKQDNDQRAFARIYEMTKPYVYGIVKSKIYNADDIEDVMQNIYMSLFQSIDSYDTSRPFFNWFSSIINHKITDRIRKIYAQRIETALGDDAPVSDIISDMLDSEANISELHKLIDQLPDNMKHILTLYYIEGKNTAEIAELLDVQQNSITGALSRGRNKLKLMILDYEQENNTKLHSVIWITPITKMFAEPPKIKIPASISKNVFTSVAKAAGLSKASGLCIGGIAVMGSVGVKVAIVSTAIVLTGCSIGIPVYVHNEQEKAAQAVEAMAVIEVEESNSIMEPDTSSADDVSNPEEYSSLDESHLSDQDRIFLDEPIELPDLSDILGDDNTSSAPSQPSSIIKRINKGFAS